MTVLLLIFMLGIPAAGNAVTEPLYRTTGLGPDCHLAGIAAEGQAAQSCERLSARARIEKRKSLRRNMFECHVTVWFHCR